MNEHLGDVLEMSVSRQNSQAILHGGGSDPEVVGGNRPTDGPESIQNDGIALGRFFIHSHHADTRRSKKLLESFPVLIGMPTMLKPGLQFTQDDRIDSNRVRRLNGFFYALMSAHERGIGGRVQKDAHYFLTAQVFRLKAIHYLARHESSHSRPSRFLRP